eukprot:jgi/Picre1/32211/NNA_007557.t1
MSGSIRVGWSMGPMDQACVSTCGPSGRTVQPRVFHSQPQRSHSSRRLRAIDNRIESDVQREMDVDVNLAKLQKYVREEDQHDVVLSVCSSKHCCKRGSTRVLKALQEDAMRINGLRVDVRSSTCLGQCKRGPAVHVSIPAHEEEVTCVKVACGHDVQQLAAVALDDTFGQ